LFIVDHGDKALEVHRVVEPGHGLREDVSQQAGFFAKIAQYVGIVVQQFLTGLLFQAFPIVLLWDLDALFISHFEKEQIGELFNIIPVINAVMTQGMAEPPEFVYNIRHSHFPYYARKACRHAATA